MNKILVFIFLATIPSFIDLSDEPRHLAQYNLSKEQEIICKAAYQTAIDLGQTKYHALHVYNSCARKFTQKNKSNCKAQKKLNPNQSEIKPTSSRVEKPNLKNDESFNLEIQQRLARKRNVPECLEIKNIVYTVTGDLPLAKKAYQQEYYQRKKTEAFDQEFKNMIKNDIIF